MARHGCPGTTAVSNRRLSRFASRGIRVGRRAERRASAGKPEACPAKSHESERPRDQRDSVGMLRVHRLPAASGAAAPVRCDPPFSIPGGFRQTCPAASFRESRIPFTVRLAPCAHSGMRRNTENVSGREAVTSSRINAVVGILGNLPQARRAPGWSRSPWTACTDSHRRRDHRENTR